MAVYIMLSKVSPEAMASGPEGFKKLAAEVSERIKSECPAVDWRESYATMGQYDVVDIIEADDPKQVERAAMIIRSLGHSNTETMMATPWKEFLADL